MTICFYFLICLFLVIIQTTLIPLLPFVRHFFDLSIPFIVYLSLFRNTWEGLPVILCLGLVMDSVSGTPLGLYLTAYGWFFFMVRWMTYLLHVRGRLFMPFVVLLGVVFENLIFVFTVIVSGEGTHLSLLFYRFIPQFIWAVLLGTFCVYFFTSLRNKWDYWTVEWYHRNKKRRRSIWWWDLTRE
jgi:rod shape-determining protein MreD